MGVYQRHYGTGLTQCCCLVVRGGTNNFMEKGVTLMRHVVSVLRRPRFYHLFNSIDRVCFRLTQALAVAAVFGFPAHGSEIAQGESGEAPPMSGWETPNDVISVDKGRSRSTARFPVRSV